jgi:hypothetical protein
MKNTLCEKCYFSQKASSNKSCVFDIPNIIKDFHSIEIENDYIKINNYSCRYGFSKVKYQENIDKLSDLDMIEYVKKNNIVQYSLSLIVKDYNPEQICQKINQLSILPYYITIICYEKAESLHKILQSKEDYIPYKIHKFLEDISPPQALHIALETNKNKIGNLMWILDETGLDHAIEEDSIQNINYLINVVQKPAHYYNCKKLNSQFNGVFINTNNYWNLSRTINYEIENNENTLVISYD